MIKMQMGIYHVLHIRKSKSQFRERILQHRPAVSARILYSIDVQKLLVLFVPNSCIDQHEARVVLNQQTTER
jgi:hypothetical protein